MQYVQCFPLYNAAALKRLVNYSAKASAEILLDLEDSVCDVSNQATTHEFKKNARRTLIELVDFLMLLQTETRIHIRINAMGSAYFADDIECLKKIAGIKLESIFIPKVKCNQDLSIAVKALTDASILFNHISPIAETKEGVCFFQRQYRANSAFKVKTVYFGNYDYNLSCGNYPIIEQNIEQYWQTVIPLIKRIELLGLTFGNSPYANLKDTPTFVDSINRLKNICKNDFYVCCLNLVQTKIAKDHIHSMAFKESIAPLDTQTKDLSQEFLLHRAEGRSFAYNPFKKRIITPHEYLLNLEKSYVR